MKKEKNTNTNQNGDTSGLVHINNREIKEVAILLKRLIGDRSIRKTAEDSGVAASYISGILKEKHLPSANILRKLAATDAKPQNGVTLEDLMIAAGYQKNYSKPSDYDIIKDGFLYEINNESYNKKSMLERIDAYQQYLASYANENDGDSRLLYKKYESIVSGILYNGMMKKGIKFGGLKKSGRSGMYQPDIVVSVSESCIKEWWFELKYIGNNGEFANYRMMTTIMRMFIVAPSKDRKISLVINNKSAFEYIINHMNNIAYRGDFSIILVDDENYEIKDEVYLSHYMENSKESEFYIV